MKLNTPTIKINIDPATIEALERLKAAFQPISDAIARLPKVETQELEPLAEPDRTVTLAIRIDPESAREAARLAAELFRAELDKAITVTREPVTGDTETDSEPDPLDENDHRDRLDSYGNRWTRSEWGCWHLSNDPLCGARCDEATLKDLDELHGPLTLAPDADPAPAEASLRPYTRRLASCVEQWFDCESGKYDPSCCRFPKSCSPHAVRPDSRLEPQPEGTYEPDINGYCHEDGCGATISAPHHKLHQAMEEHRQMHAQEAAEHGHMHHAEDE